MCVCLHDAKQKIERPVFFDAFLWMQLDFLTNSWFPMMNTSSSPFRATNP